MNRDKFKSGTMETLRDFAMALVIVLIFMAALMAYCRVWPPMVVVESGSMMHGDDSMIGVIDTGDMVLVRKVTDKNDVMTYAEGELVDSGTYSSFGEVIIYNPNGDKTTTPIIHRAMLWLEVNTSHVQPLPGDRIDYQNYSFDIPAYGLYDTTDDLVIENYGAGYNPTWRPPNIIVRLKGTPAGSPGLLDRFEDYGVAPYDGFLTMGDHNGGYDQSGSGLLPVKMDWVVGKAAGELPWFGLVKLGITNDLPDVVPSNSWLWLFVSISLMVGIPLIIDFGLPLILGKKDEDNGDGENEDRDDDLIPLDDEELPEPDDVVDGGGAAADTSDNSEPPVPEKDAVRPDIPDDEGVPETSSENHTSGETKII